MFIVIISSIIVVVSLFIGFFPHTEHCGMLSSVGIHKCPGWEFHIVLGGLLYILAVFISQKGDADIITSYVTSYTSNTPKELLPQ
jgi:hypothetical protein